MKKYQSAYYEKAQEKKKVVYKQHVKPQDPLVDAVLQLDKTLNLLVKAWSSDPKKWWKGGK